MSFNLNCVECTSLKAWSEKGLCLRLLYPDICLSCSMEDMYEEPEEPEAVRSCNSLKPIVYCLTNSRAALQALCLVEDTLLCSLYLFHEIDPDAHKPEMQYASLLQRVLSLSLQCKGG